MGRRGACVCVCVREVQTSDIVTPDSLISIDYFTAAILVERGRKRRINSLSNSSPERERETREIKTHTERGTFGLLLDFLGEL